MFKKTTAAMFSLVAGALMVATPANAQSADWQRSVARLVAAKQTYPRAAQMRGDEGTAKVKVNVTADGSIGNVELVAPSGSSVLDREALALPAKVGKFPPPPGGAASVVLPRSEEPRVGKEGVSKCRSRWGPSPTKKKNNTTGRKRQTQKNNHVI